MTAATARAGAMKAAAMKAAAMKAAAITGAPQAKRGVRLRMDLLGMDLFARPAHQPKGQSQA